MNLCWNVGQTLFAENKNFENKVYLWWQKKQSQKNKTKKQFENITHKKIKQNSVKNDRYKCFLQNKNYKMDYKNVIE